MDNGPVLWCNDLRKRFKERLAVDGVGFEVTVAGASLDQDPGQVKAAIGYLPQDVASTRT
jgi:hypothetical protein